MAMCLFAWADDSSMYRRADEACTLVAPVQCIARVVCVRAGGYTYLFIPYFILFDSYLFLVFLLGGVPRQNDILVDSADPEYEQFLVDQLTRHVDRLPHFAGIAIDRSDMMEFYDLDGDDGVSAVYGNFDILLDHL